MAGLAIIAGSILLLIGAFLCLSGAVGLLRFPDFYTRIHAAGVTDTLGGALIMVGLMLQPGTDFFVFAKLFFIVLFFFFTIPTSSHALALAARLGGVQPLLGKQSREDRSKAR